MTDFAKLQTLKMCGVVVLKTSVFVECVRRVVVVDIIVATPDK